MMRLREICGDLVQIGDESIIDIAVAGIATDSRQVESGDIFIAITGFQADGHRFVDEAIKRGAAALIVEHDVGTMPIPVFFVEDSRKAAAVMANRFFGKPSEELLMVGITGTNGKTTVSYLLESILSCSGLEPGLIGTMIYRWKGKEFLADHTTPDAVVLQRFLSDMRNDGVKAVAMEVSSHALALDRAFGIEFDAAVFTNLSRDHLDFHSSFSDYGKSKAKLFSMLKKDIGVGIINGDDPAGGLMLEASKGRTVTFGQTNRKVDYHIDDIQMSDSETRFSITYSGQKHHFSIQLCGCFNVPNSAAAAITGLELGLDAGAVREGLQRVQQVRGRMESINSGRGYRVIIDYAHTPDALSNVLRAARKLTKEHLTVVFGCGGDRDRGKRPEMGKIAGTLADRIIVTSDNPRGEEPTRIIQDILNGIQSKKNVESMVDRKEAIHMALNEAGEGDVVVIAGKGHETYQQIGQIKNHFDDREVVLDYLAR